MEIPAHPLPLKSGYLKVRDRQSYEFALTTSRHCSKVAARARLLPCD